jgi:aryl-alcohol dehydrogenase-like predicted oxidoreductase
MRTILHSIPGMTASQAAFAYILSNAQVNSCVFGTTSLSNLKDILSAIDLELDESVKNAIRDTFDALPRTVSA